MTKITFYFKNLLASLVMFSSLLIGAQDGTYEIREVIPARPACELPLGE